ncbi:uncharacterized protein LOC117113897 [Anneissia japonica]|uniref:uncharacterized protein LOC117113897 n=1 Tax=Anneissia japonica TaxID=1529436 RepID=UPI00142590F7|nr:uncharacterized protein LOC117113897 [Anneissia japonica]
MKWQRNVQTIVKRAQKRIYFLRRRKSFGMHPTILMSFCRAVIESILTLSITVWFGGATENDLYALNRIVRTATHIIGLEQMPLETIFHDRLLKKAEAIMGDQTHPASNLFQLMCSGRRFRSLKATKARFRNSFFPRAIRALNCRRSANDVDHSAVICEVSPLLSYAGEGLEHIVSNKRFQSPLLLTEKHKMNKEIEIN